MCVAKHALQLMIAAGSRPQECFNIYLVCTLQGVLGLCLLQQLLPQAAAQQRLGLLLPRNLLRRQGALCQQR